MRFRHRFHLSRGEVINCAVVGLEDILADFVEVSLKIVGMAGEIHTGFPAGAGVSPGSEKNIRHDMTSGCFLYRYIIIGFMRKHKVLKLFQEYVSGEK